MLVGALGTLPAARRAEVAGMATKGPDAGLQSGGLKAFWQAIRITPNIGKLSSMYLYAWKRGLKTTYYLRSRPATRINQTNTSRPTSPPAPTDGDAVTCSLENPEHCDACQ